MASTAAAAPSHSLLAELSTSGISVSTATLFTNPLDVIKTRLQLQRSSLPTSGLPVTAASAQPSGLVGTATSIVRNEGILGLWKGVTPSVARGLTYGGLRLGLYSPIKAAFSSKDGQLSFAGKFTSGALAGSIAAAATSPIELLKTRMQVKGTQQQGAIAILRGVLATDGVVGLWRGGIAGMTRAALLTASQAATYDQVKQAVMTRTGWADHAGTHFVSSMISGVVVTTVTNPPDMVKTLMFTQGSSKYGGSMLKCAADIMKTEGAAGFMKGWTANYARLGPQTVIIFLVAEQLRDMAGLRKF